MLRWAAAGWLALLTLVLLGSPAVRAQTPGAAEAMAGANELYDAGDFGQAAQAYQQLVDQGHREAALFYNLGNAYYKLDMIGLAVLNYLRAEKLDPRDEDIQANIEIARGQTADVLETDGGFPLFDVLSAPWLTDDELSTVVLVLWFVTAISLVVWIFARMDGIKRAAAYVAAVAGVLVLLSGASLGGRLLLDGTEDDAVIVAGAVEVMSGPGDRYITEFELHAGAEARLIEERGSWARVALPGDELQGWVPAAAVELVALP